MSIISVKELKEQRNKLLIRNKQLNCAIYLKMKWQEWLHSRLEASCPGPRNRTARKNCKWAPCYRHCDALYNAGTIIIQSKAMLTHFRQQHKSQNQL